MFSSAAPAPAGFKTDTHALTKLLFFTLSAQELKPIEWSHWCSDTDMIPHRPGNNQLCVQYLGPAGGTGDMGGFWLVLVVVGGCLCRVCLCVNLGTEICLYYPLNFTRPLLVLRHLLCSCLFMR